MYFFLQDINPRIENSSLFPIYKLVKEKGGLPRDVPTNARGEQLAFREEKVALSMLRKLNNRSKKRITLSNREG